MKQILLQHSSFFLPVFFHLVLLLLYVYIPNWASLQLYEWSSVRTDHLPERVTMSSVESPLEAKLLMREVTL